MAEALFWLSLALVLYPYLGYPFLLALLGLVWGKSPARDEHHEPRVTLLISAYNEEEVIAEKLENSLRLDYPREKLEIVVASESTDRTNEIVAGYCSRGVKLHAFSQRRGKSALLHATVPLACSAIVVFSDANALYDPSALKKLVRNFADPRVGCVSGELVYEPGSGAAALSESLYWKYEQWLKRLESRLFSLLGANGSIFALRKELYAPLSETRGDDFELPVRVLLAGSGAVLEPDARSRELSAPSVSAEFRRRVRMVSWFLTSAWLLLAEALCRRRVSLAVQLVSHRLLRWLAPAFLLALAASSAAAEGALYRTAFWLQIVFYGAAATGWAMDARRTLPPVWLRLPYYFCALHLAVLVGLRRSLGTPGGAGWEKVR